VPAISRQPRKTAGLAFAQLLALALLALCLIPMVGGTLATRINGRVMEAALSQPLWEMRLGRNVALFALGLLAVHMAFGVVCWLLALAARSAWPRAPVGLYSWIGLWFASTGLWMLFANAVWFPNSMFGFPLHELATTRVFGVSLFTLVTLLLGLAIGLTLALAVARHPARRPLVIALGGAAALAGATAFLPHGQAASAHRAGRPNVILLGVDSLRPQAVNPRRTPNVDAMLKASSQATDAITPLARTFPSWVSILSGRNPHTTGAWMNLLPREIIHTGLTLPEILRQQGYWTSYAIDETRFSNIDRSYGFDQTITPSIGASDFVLGTYADFPLCNLLVDTRLGKWLFPQLYTNRAVPILYDPDSFIRRMDSELRFEQPLFLAVHLTLPHWPYSWATSVTNPEEGSGEAGLYMTSLQRADRQFGDLLDLLRRKGALDNALVVVLSDHGQELHTDTGGLAGQLPENARAGFLAQSGGHGTSVLSPVQYQVVLGFRGYGEAARLLPPPGTLDAPVSLIDVAPTVLDLLSIPAPEPFDGVSLVPALQGGAAAMPELADRIRFTETEYSPRNFSTANLTGSALAEAAQAYLVDPSSDRVSVRTNWLPQLLSNRQYAALLGNRTLAAALPGLRKDGQHQLFMITDPLRRATGKPVVTDANASAAEETERLRIALQDVFKVRIAPPSDYKPGS
jgi:hypothetical protein